MDSNEQMWEVYTGRLWSKYKYVYDYEEVYEREVVAFLQIGLYSIYFLRNKYRHTSFRREFVVITRFSSSLSFLVLGLGCTPSPQYKWTM